MFLLSLVFGSIVGFSLGLTGGGGSIFAVPFLVYGLSVAPREAVGVSLAAVGITALVGTLDRLRARQVEVRTGLIFAFAGMLGAPVGSCSLGSARRRLVFRRDHPEGKGVQPRDRYGKRVDGHSRLGELVQVV